MSGGNSGTSSAGSNWTNKNYPNVPYESNDFHATCAITNYNDASNVQNCELSGLQDLNTGSTYVRGKAVAFTDNHDTQRGHGGGGSNLTYHYGSDLRSGQRFYAGVAVRLSGANVELCV